jgi:hypothetical protein
MTRTPEDKRTEILNLYSNRRQTRDLKMSEQKPEKIVRHWAMYIGIIMMLFAVAQFVLGVICLSSYLSVPIFLQGFSVPTFNTIVLAYLVCGIFFMLAGIFNIEGGMMALERKEFGVVVTSGSFSLASSILCLFLSLTYFSSAASSLFFFFPLISIIVLILVELSKLDFKSV